MTPLVILDPALGRTGAHNQGFAELLINQGADANSLGLWCHDSIGRSLRDRLTASGIVVRPTFSIEFYQVIGKGGGVADHWHWVQALAVQYLDALEEVLDKWPCDGIRVIHHTLSWEHANALSLALRLLGQRGDRLNHFAFLMYSPGIDEAGRVFDAERCLNFRLAFRALDLLPNLRLYASCGEYASAYAALLNRSVPLPLHPCFIGDWRLPPPRRVAAEAGYERILLYVGEIKQEKGFLRLPATLMRLLDGSPPTRRFVLQFLDVRNPASKRVLSLLEQIASKHQNVEIHLGFWSDETLHHELANCAVFNLDYDAAAYAHKTSGLLWLAAWYNLPVIVPSDGWLRREATRLGLDIRVDAFAEVSETPINNRAMDPVYRRALFTPFWQWLEQEGRPLGRRAAIGRYRTMLRAPATVDGVDVVLFWKQNDSSLYGRRVDMVVRYLASRQDVRRVLVIDAPIGQANLATLANHKEATHHGQMVHARTLEKVAGTRDSGKVAYRVFVCPAGQYRFEEDGSARPRFIEGYIEYLQDVFAKERIDSRQAVFWLYPRNFQATELVRKFDPARVVVDVVDDDRMWPNVSDDAKRQLTNSLRAILQKADMAFANCLPVWESMRGVFPEIRLVPNGCDLDPPRTRPRTAAFRQFCSRPGKVIGFVGNLEAKIDIDLLHKVAECFGDCNIVLIGSTHANPKVLELSCHANVSMPGAVPYDEIDAWLRRFDVGLIPHLAMDLTRHMNPLKTYVYLSRSVPVVSTSIPNVDSSHGLVRSAATHSEFVKEIAKVLSGDRPLASTFRNYAQNNSWETRFKTHVDQLMLDLV